MDMFDKIFKTGQGVVEDWGIIELFFFIILMPFSLFYVAMRFFQEWDNG